MTTEDKLNALDDAYISLVEAGRVRNKSDFAALLGVHRTTLSSAMNGDPRYLTDSLVSKAISLKKETQDPAAPAQAEPSRSSGIYIPRETLDLYTNLSETCRNLSAIVARMGVAAPALQSFAPAQKNSTTDPLP